MLLIVESCASCMHVLRPSACHGRGRTHVCHGPPQVEEALKALKELEDAKAALEKELQTVGGMNSSGTCRMQVHLLRTRQHSRSPRSVFLHMNAQGSASSACVHPWLTPRRRRPTRTHWACS